MAAPAPSGGAGAAAAVAPAAALAGTSLFVGVDGGGTKTAISVADQNGRMLTTITVGSSNPNSVTDAGAAHTVSAGIRQALANIGGKEGSVKNREAATEA